MRMLRWLAAGAGAAATVAVYSTVVEPRWLQVSRPVIHLRSLPPALEGFRIGLLSDLHVERGRGLGVVRRAVTTVMKERPDLVAVTGDLAEDQPALHAVLDALMPLAAPVCVGVVPGNHDHIAGIHNWRRAVEARKAIRDLTNTYVLVEHAGATVCVAGVDDHIEGSPRLTLPPPGARDLTIVLAHSPDQAERCRRSYDAVDLILSGHTHGGQVRLPFVGAPVTAADRPDLYDNGLRRRPWTQVYTSRGLGTSRLPIRFLARPEVAILTLTRSPRPPRHPRATRFALELHARSDHIGPPARSGDDPTHPRGAYENP